MNLFRVGNPWRHVPSSESESVLTRIVALAWLRGTFSLLPQMPRRNADNPSSQRANKRVRSSIPKFRVATTNRNAGRTSRVTILKRGPSGRRGYRTLYIVHPPSDTGPPEISIDQQRDTDENFLDLPVDLDADDSATSTATPIPKPKRTQKKHNLGEFSISHSTSSVSSTSPP